MRRPVIIIISLLCCLLASAQTTRVRYVKTTGSYTADGTTWKTAKNNIQDAINDLRATGDGTGSVYVAKGTYYPTESTETNADGTLYTSIKIYEGISVYGGFAKDETNDKITPGDRKITCGTTEITIGEYEKNATSYPQRWSMVNTTTISGNHSTHKEDFLTWNDTKHTYTTTFPGNSYHVVWFATNGFDSDNHAKALTKEARIDGFTITGGYASNRVTNNRDHTSYGGGVYMVDGSYMSNCRITENASMRRGGGVYLDGGGDVKACMIFKNQCAGVGVVEGYGGGICIDGKGHLRHSVVMLNSARIGGGLALCHDNKTTGSTDEKTPMAAGCIVNNNSSTSEAGGVLMYQGGTINHLTIVNNKCWGADVINDGRRLGRTGGLYIDKVGLVYNTVSWGNEGLNEKESSAVQYAAYTANSSSTSGSMPEVYFSAFSQNEITDWSGSKRTSVYTLTYENDGKSSSTTLAPRFNNPSSGSGITTLDDKVSWAPLSTTDLRGMGIKLKDYVASTETSLLEAGIESDMFGKSFSPRCMIGAICPVNETFTIALLSPVGTSDPAIPTLFVDPSGNNRGKTENVGASWASPIYMVNDALTYFSKRQNSDGSFTISNKEYSNCQILVKEGTGTNMGNYRDENLRSSCLDMVSNVSLYGGYPSSLSGVSVSDRNPKDNPTRITANVSADEYKRNAFHVVSFNGVKNVTLDGFQLYGGNTTTTKDGDTEKANYVNGGGVIVQNTGSSSTAMTNNVLKNCVIANCTAQQGAAVMVEASCGSDAVFTMENCIVHNNEAQASSIPAAIADSSGTLTINHCTIRGNVGYAVYNGGGTVTMNNSVAHANMLASATSIPTSGTFVCFDGSISGSNNLWDNSEIYNGLSNTGTTLTHTYSDSDGTYPKFKNPTTTIGVQESLEDVTKYGGDPDFTPMYPNPMINAANDVMSDSNTYGTTSTDLTCTHLRSYGGAADIGALEDTLLLKYGYTYYVSKKGSDSNSGLSWDKAFATVRKAVYEASKSSITIDKDGHKPEVWVAAGTYTQSPVTSSDNYDYDSNNTNSCFNIREGVNVYGAFPSTGNPGKNERQPLVSSAIYNSVPEGTTKDEYITKYETILTTSSSNCRILGQPSNYNPGNSSYSKFSIKTTWDGFTITGGNLSNSYDETRDGGAGVRLFYNVNITDCVINDNKNTYTGSYSHGGKRAGGVYCEGGSIINCYLINNKIVCSYTDKRGQTYTGKYGACYGGGAYIYEGTMYNCVVANNSITANFADGAGLFLEKANFFNNTVVNNTGDSSNGISSDHRESGGITIYNDNSSVASTLNLYNCIVAYNNGFSGANTGSKNVAMQGPSTHATLYNCLLDTDPTNVGTSSSSSYILYNDCSNYTSTTTKWYSIFKYVNESNYTTFNLCNYRLDGTNGVNMGEDYPNNIDLSTYTDMDYTDRIKDCRVDIGAYEYDGTGDIPDEYVSTDTSHDKIYYVSQNGSGDRSAKDATNAACWEKLQKVLDAAGRYKYDCEKNGVTDVNITVRLAEFSKYQPRRLASGTNSTAGTGSSEETPRMYSIVVPQGVTVEGGYNDKDTLDCKPFGYRNVLQQPTVLTGEYQSDEQDVNVYHTVTFTTSVFNENGKAISGETLSTGKAILDGLFITGGMAEGVETTSGDRNGGAAIVTDYAHIRNCIIYGNEAKGNGGALYLEPGAMVSGCIITKNTAEGEGGAIYVEWPEDDTTTETTTTTSTPSIIFTSTIVGNTADSGGGVYFPTSTTNAVRINSTVLWQNSASSNENIAGLLNPTSVGTDIYPMSFCAVENMRVAGINNISVNTEDSKGTRFDEDYDDKKFPECLKVAINNDMDNDTVLKKRFFYLKQSSALARAGMAQTDWTKYHTDHPTLEYYDLAGVNRKYDGNVYIEIGARAFDGALVATATTGKIMYRLFVAPTDKSNAGNAAKLQNSGGTYYSQRGSCMDNPMNHLDDALEYIRNARKDTLTIYSDDKTISEEVKDKVFEIYVSGGTFYPYRNLSGTYTESRDKTFAVPEGVHIYGGIDPESHYAGMKDTEGNSIDGESTVSGLLTTNLLIYPTETILDARTHFDHNANNIVEPWEMEQQTILSGEVVNSSDNKGSYHVVMCIADEDVMGKLPTNQKKNETDENAFSGKGDGTEAHEIGKRVVVDGVTISDGEAYGYSDKVISEDTYYKGGAICVQGNWYYKDSLTADGGTATINKDKIKSYDGIDRPVGYRDIPLEVRNCQFSNNKAGMGGAIFTDGELTVFGCRFVQNYAEDAASITVNSTTITPPGRGGCINSSSDVTVVNTLFANNETKHNNGDGENYGGVFVAGEYSKVNMINCDLVRNKSAASYPAMYVYGNEKDHVNIVNTIFWGNEASSSGEKLVINKINENGTDVENNQLWFCAYEDGCWSDPVTTTVDGKRDFRKAYYNYDSGLTIPEMLTAYNDSITDKNYRIPNAAEINNNIILSSDNDALDGPNFITPSDSAGVDGYMQSADWMMGRLNNLVDNGWTFLEQEVGINETTFVIRDNKEGSGIYLSTAQQMNSRKPERLRMAYGNKTYMSYNDKETGNVMYRISPDPNPTHEQSYIDIGVYEYQHVKLNAASKNEVDSLWVCEKENTSSSSSDGSVWERATSDLQRAIETLLSSRNGHKKKIMLLKGTYQPVYTISGNLAFTIQTDFLNSGASSTDNNGTGVKSLTIQGGYSNEIKDVYDVEDYPAEFYSADRSSAERSTQGYVFCITNAEQIFKNNSGTSTAQGVAIPITFDGITFYNNKGLTTTGEDNKNGGAAIYYQDQYKSTSGTDGSNKTTTPLDAPSDGSKKLTLKNCKIVASGGGVTSHIPCAMYVGTGGGEALIYNTLFHSNYGDPLVAYGTTVVNCTFALNGGLVKLQTDRNYKSAIHNSLLWKNNSSGTQYSLEGSDMTNNAIQGYTSTSTNDTNEDLDADNDDVINGPNFIDPKEDVSTDSEMLERDFGLNPSSKTLSKGDSITYYNKVFSKSVDKNNLTDTDKTTIAAALKGETDLGGNKRIYGGGLERGAYECLVQTRRVLYVNPNFAKNENDGWSWQNAFGKSQLQKAIDAAAVYAASKGDDAYVFVRGSETSLGENITLRDNVKIFGNIPTTTFPECGHTTIEGSTEETISNTQIEAYLNTVNSYRPGVASPSATQTIITGISSPSNTTFNKYSLVDGFVITNPSTDADSPIINVASGSSLVLRNSIVAGNSVTGNNIADIDKGLLYNVLFRDNNVDDGKYIVNLGDNAYMVNCTVGKAGGVYSTIPSDTNIPTNRVYNSIIKTRGESDAPFMVYDKCEPLKSNKNLQYQLHENAYSIDKGTDVSAKINDIFSNAINYSTDRDLLGNPRMINAEVDNGCYETWNVAKDDTLLVCSKAHKYPHEGSVVYIHTGGKMLLEKGNFTSSDNAFSPAYVLVCDSGSLYGQGNYINLPYVAVERNLNSNKYALVSLPYKFNLANVSTPDYTKDYDSEDKNMKEAAVSDYAAYYYNSEDRATSDYSFKESNTSLWWDGTNNGKAIASKSEIKANDGWLFDITSSETTSTSNIYRFTACGKSATDYVYTEDGTDKKVFLTQYDNCTTNNTGKGSSSYDFTNEYNMGWNLKGLPYLVSDYYTGVKEEEYETATTFPMNIPHIVYTMKDDGNYNPYNSWEKNTKLSVGDGFFTQTAIIGDGKTETLTFNTPEYITTRATYTKTRSIVISNEGGEDEVQVNPVTENASLSYTIGSDGAKLMALNDTLPQIYVVGVNDARMSLASKAPVEEDIRLGFVAKRAGVYTISSLSPALPQGEGDESDDSLPLGGRLVGAWLTDHLTGSVVNLNESSYTMNVDGDGEYLDRLTIRFGGAKPVTPRGDSDSNSYTIRVDGSTVTIYGLSVGDNVRIVTAGGALFDSFTARNSEETRQLHKGYYVVNINGFAKTILCR